MEILVFSNNINTWKKFQAQLWTQTSFTSLHSFLEMSSKKTNQNWKHGDLSKTIFWFSVLGLLHLMKQKRVEHSRFVKCSSTWLQSEYCEDSWISLSHRNSFRLHFNKDLSRHGGYLCIMSVFLFSALQQVWCDSEDQFDQQVFDLFPVEAFNS